MTAALDTNDRPLLNTVLSIMIFSTRVLGTFAPLVTLMVIGVKVMTAFIDAFIETDTK